MRSLDGAPALHQEKEHAMDRDSADIQTLRLLKAFFEVKTHQSREMIVRLTEAAAEPGSTLTVTSITPAPDKLH
jgi:hypothetical protein